MRVACVQVAAAARRVDASVRHDERIKLPKSAASRPEASALVGGEDCSRWSGMARTRLDSPRLDVVRGAWCVVRCGTSYLPHSLQQRHRTCSAYEQTTDGRPALACALQCVREDHLDGHGDLGHWSRPTRRGRFVFEKRQPPSPMIRGGRLAFPGFDTAVRA